jgi:hypothetical protein
MLDLDATIYIHMPKVLDAYVEPCLIQHCKYNSSYVTLSCWSKAAGRYAGIDEVDNTLGITKSIVHYKSWVHDIVKWRHYFFACSCTALWKVEHSFSLVYGPSLLSHSHTLNLATVPSVLLLSSLQLAIVHPIHLIYPYGPYKISTKIVSQNTFRIGKLIAGCMHGPSNRH